MTPRLRPVVLPSSLFLVSVVPADSATTAVPVYDLDPLVVVAPNLWAREAKLSRESIQSAKPVDLATILSSKLPAAALTRKGPLAGDIVLRGLSRDNIRVSVDDTETFCACPNRMDPPAFHVSSQQIESISVRTGPFSVEDGSGVGGKIEVRTSEASDDPFARFYGYGGSFDYYAGGLTAGSPLGGAWSGLGGVYFQQGGVYEDGEGVRFTQLPGTNYQARYFDETAFDVTTAEAKLTRQVGEEGELSFAYAYQNAEDVFYPGLRMDAPSDEMNRGSVVFRSPVDWAIADRIEVGVAGSRVEHDMTDAFRTSLNNMGGRFADRGYFMRTFARSSVIGARAKLSKDIGEDAFVRYGVDAKRRKWDANNEIGMMRNDMLPNVANDSLGVWGVYELLCGEWAFEAGGRMDLGRSEARGDLTFVNDLRGTSSNEQWDLLPSAYGLASRNLSEEWKLYGGIGVASRMPDPQERYMNLNRPGMNSDWVGNPDLNPMYNLETQGGVSWEGEKLEARLGVFHSWLYDAIYLARLDAGAGATTYENLDARLYGFSGDLSWEPVEQLRLEAGFAWQEGVKESRPASATNDVFGEVPPLRGRIAAVYELGDFTARAELQMQDDFDRVDPDLNESPIGGWTVLNLAASYRISEKFSLSAGVDNVFDETYAVSNSFVRDPFRSGVVVNEPGRFWFVRAGVEF